MKNKRILFIRIGLLAILLVAVGVVYVFVNKHPQMKDEQIPMSRILFLDDKSKKIIADVGLLDEKSKVLLSSEVVEVVNNATMAVLRKDRYGVNSSMLEKILWEEFTGALPVAYANYLDINKMSKEPLLQSIESIKDFTDPVTGDSIDFIHMIAVVDVYASNVHANAYQEKYYDYLLSWGGDLESFLMDLIAYSDAHQQVSYEAFYQYASQTIGTEKPSHFSREDLLADMDGLNIAVLIEAQDLLLSEALNTYYVDGLVAKRYELFMDYFGGQEAFAGVVNHFLNDTVETEYQNQKEYVAFRTGFTDVKKMMIKVMSNSPLREATKAERQATENAFVALMTSK